MKLSTSITNRPAPAPAPPAHTRVRHSPRTPLELTNMPERERPQERAERRGCRHPSQQPVRPPRTQHLRVIDAVTAEHHREQQPEHLATRVSPPPDAPSEAAPPHPPAARSRAAR